MSFAMHPDFELMLSSPENECRHGRCPGDTSPKCGCWTDLEGAPPMRLTDARRSAPSVFAYRPTVTDVLGRIAVAA